MIELNVVNVKNHPAAAGAATLAALGATYKLFRTSSGGLLHLVEHEGVPQGLEAVEAKDLLEAAEAAGLLALTQDPPGGAAGSHGRAQACRLLERLAGPLGSQAYFPTIAHCVAGPAVKLDAGKFKVRSYGYDLDDQVFCMKGAGGLPEADPAYPHLRAIFSGLAFADPVYHANLLGYLVAAIARTSVREFPLLLLDSRLKSCGKTSVASAIAYVLSGVSCSPLASTGNEEELEKKLGGFAGKPGPNVIFFDNVRAKRGQPHQIRAQLFSILATSSDAGIRGIYRDSLPLFDPIVIFTMNGGQVESDLGDRCVRVLLTRPAGTLNRALVPHPLYYAREHRSALLAEALHILQAITLPPLSEAPKHHRCYLFEQIALEAAKALGLEACFAGDRVDSADSFICELVSLFETEFPGASSVPAASLVSAARADRALHELNAWLDQHNVPQKALPKLLHEAISDWQLIPYRVRGKTYVFTASIDADGTRTISLGEAS